MYWKSHVKLLDAVKYRTKRPGNRCSKMYRSVPDWSKDRGEQVIQNLNTGDEYIKVTVMNVQETNNFKEDSTTNGSQRTVSQKTQTSIKLLLNGVKSLVSKVTNVNPNYKDTIDWKTLLTTTVENFYAVSHFKHETFDALQYATNLTALYRRNRWSK